MLEEYVKDNYYARFDTRSYYHFTEMHFNARLNVNNARLDLKSRHLSAKSRSGALGHSACLKSLSRTITMKSLIHAAINVTEKST